ncbi:MAG: hypothetical protein ACHQLA_05735, partial [Ignavibacteriales bacterium]
MAKKKSVSESIPQGEESKKKNQRIFITYFLFLIYVLITTASITDIQLVLNDYVTLPIINIRVSTTSFFLISPLFLISLFVFYQLHYLHISSNISEVLQYPDWPLFEFANHKIIEQERDYLNKIQNVLSKIIIWGLLPITLIVITFRSLESHDGWLIGYLSVCSFIGITLSFIFWSQKYSFSKENLALRIVLSFILTTFLFFFYSLCLNEIFMIEILPLIDKDLKLISVFALFLILTPLVNYILQRIIIKSKTQYLISLN